MADRLSAARGTSQAPRGRRLRRFVLGSAAAGLIAVLGVVITSVRSGGSNSGPGSSTAAGAPNRAVLSTAPVTDPTLRSWAAAALLGQTSPSADHIGQAIRPNSAPATARSESPYHPSGTPTGDPAAACLQAPVLLQPSMTQRQLLSSASGDYGGGSAILLVYSNGTDADTAYIVVFTAPCHGSDSTLLASGVIPR